MKFKSEIKLFYKYLLIYSYLILKANAASFSSGGFRSSPIKTSTYNLRSPLRTGTHYGYGKAPVGTITAVKQPAYNSYKPVPNIIPYNNIGGNALVKQPNYNTVTQFPSPTNNVVYPVLPKQPVYNGYYIPGTTKSPYNSYRPYNPAAILPPLTSHSANPLFMQRNYNPSVGHATQKHSLGNTYPQQPPHNQFSDRTTKSPYNSYRPYNPAAIVPPLTSHSANPLFKQRNYNPSVGHATQNHSIGNLYPQQPPHNQFSDRRTNVPSTFPSTHGGFNRSTNRSDLYKGWTAMPHTSSSNELPKKSSTLLKKIPALGLLHDTKHAKKYDSANTFPKNLTNFEENITAKHMDLNNAFPRIDSTNLIDGTHEGYSNPTTEKDNTSKSKQVYKAFNYDKRNYAKSQVIVLVILVVFIAITIAVIFYVKLKK